jgi:hypothetical protein
LSLFAQLKAREVPFADIDLLERIGNGSFGALDFPASLLPVVAGY